MLVLIDDAGVERFAPYGLPADSYPSTPVMDDLAAQGVRFERAYAQPTCSPTRFNLLTGRHGRRRGLGKPLGGVEIWEFPDDERTLPEALDQAGYTSALAGKWHLSNGLVTQSPIDAGFHRHRGSLGNIGYQIPYAGAEDGFAAELDAYATTDTTDAAIGYVQTLPEPWFVWVAYNAPHRPLHIPPDPLNPRGVTGASSEVDRFHAMIEAVDLELGRLIDEVDLSNTVVVFLSDNGTYTPFLPGGWEPQQGKGTEYEAGVRVPMYVVGPGIDAAVSPVPVHAVDFFPTLIELAGLEPGVGTTAGRWDDLTLPSDPDLLDGVSVASLLESPEAQLPRRYLWFERFVPNFAPTEEWRAVRDERFKYRYRTNSDPPTEELFDLQGRHDDGPNLLLAPLEPIEADALARLQGVMDAHLLVLE